MSLVPLLLPLLGALWAFGWFRRSARRSVWRMGNTAIGAVGVWVALTWLWKNRRDAISVVAVAVLSLSVCGFVGAWWYLPERRLSLTLPVVAAALVLYVSWDYRHTAGAPLLDVLAGERDKARVRNAVTMTHDNARVAAVRRRDDGWDVDVDHVGAVDPQLVGQAVRCGSSRLAPSDKLGRSVLSLDDLDVGWSRLDRAVPWPGPSGAKATDPVTIGVDVSGAPVALPSPGTGGKHVLLAGSTGAGKSGLLSVVIAELAHRADVTLVLCDPKIVEFRSWTPRAYVASGADESGRMFDRVFDEMMRRYQAMPVGQREWQPGAGNKIVLVIDELAAITQSGPPKARTARIDHLSLILAMGRAAGVGVVGCTQRPSADVVPLDLRDNFRVRVGLGAESDTATKMIMGDSADKAPCQSIPESMPGVCFVRADRRVTLARGYLLDDGDLDRVAADTSALKKEEPWLKG